jgi:hypothetical protein
VLSAYDLVPTLWRVLSVQETGEGTVEIAAVAHNPSKYAAIEQGLQLETPPVTALDRGQAPQPPSGITTAESIYRAGPSTLATRVSVSWHQVPFAAEYECELRGRGASVGTGYAWRGRGTSCDIAPVEPGDYTVFVRAISALGVPGQRASQDVTVLGLAAPPSDVSGLTWATEGYGIRLRWEPVPDIDLADYELRVGASWATAAVIARVSATTYLWQAQATGAQTVWIAARDTSGNYSVNPASVAVSVQAPAAPTVTWALDGADELLTWTAPTSTFAIDRYEVRYGSSFAAGTPVAQLSAQLLRRRADYGGSRTWWVAAVDIAGNVGTPGRVDAAISAPATPQQPTAEVIDNNVLLRWQPGTATPSSLPVSHYIVRKGATWASGDPNADLTVSGTFAAIFEQVSGLYTYHVAAVDTAGTVGTPRAVSAQVAQPPDYVLRTQVDVDLAASGVRTNALAVDSGLLLPVDLTETWQSHFTARSWATPQQQIDAGYPIYLQPTPSSASYQYEYDYGATLSGTMATVSWVETAISGSATLTCQIDYRASTSDPWTSGPSGARQVMLTNARYVRVTLSISSAPAGTLIRVDALTLKLSSKLRTDSGSGTVTDANNGVWVSFGIPFVDADTPVVQPVGTTPLIPVVDFTDTPNPTGFRVYLYTLAGAKTTGSFSWTARGY